MIDTPIEYRKAQDELRSMEERLRALERSHPDGKGLVKAGVRKMIARLHEELAVYEGTQAVRHPQGG